jgi:hypothetical protein
MAKKKTAKKSFAFGKAEIDELNSQAAKQLELKYTDAINKLNRICGGLAVAVGLKKIVASYSGEGDSGDINYIAYEPQPTVAVSPQIEDQIKDCLYAFLPSGFEINDGGYGEIYVDIAKRTLIVESTERIVETHESVQKFKL